MAESGASSQLVIFLRLPKTAGSSLTSILSSALEPNIQVEDAATFRQFLSLPDQEKGALRLAFGHMPYGLHRFVKQKPKYVVFLRHPIDRVISNYYYIKTLGDHPLYKPIKDGMTLDMFACMAENSNAQTRRLGRYDIVEVLEPTRALDYWWVRRQRERMQRTHFDEAKECLDTCAFVGVQEDFDRDARELLLHLGLPTPPSLPRVNETIGRPRTAEIDASTADLILEQNLFDFELYRYARMIHGRLSDAPRRMGGNRWRLRARTDRTCLCRGKD